MCMKSSYIHMYTVHIIDCCNCRVSGKSSILPTPRDLHTTFLFRVPSSFTVKAYLCLFSSRLIQVCRKALGIDSRERDVGWRAIGHHLRGHSNPPGAIYHLSPGLSGSRVADTRRPLLVSHLPCPTPGCMTLPLHTN